MQQTRYVRVNRLQGVQSKYPPPLPPPGLLTPDDASPAPCMCRAGAAGARQASSLSLLLEAPPPLSFFFLFSMGSFWDD